MSYKLSEQLKHTLNDESRTKAYDRTRRDVRFLKGYAVVSTLAFSVIAVAAFRQPDQAQHTQKQHFGEIDVERMNIVEKDGTPRMIISNKARFPGLILHGKEYPHPRNQAGILFFNNEGTENGGLATGIAHQDGKYSANSQIMFDQYEQDQTVGIAYSDNNGKRTAGLYVWDRPDAPIQPIVEKLQAVRAMPDGAEKTAAMQALRASGLGGPQRVIVGKRADRSAMVMLADTTGQPRLRLLVDSTGAPRIEFLDANGKVTSTIPGSR